MTDKVIVYGGRGGLGVAVVKAFKAAGFWVASVDLAANDQADANVLVSLADGWVEQEAAVCRGVEEALQGARVVAVINVAGGWAGGCASDKDWVKNADLMWKQSVWSSAIAGSLAARHLADGGLLVLPGAQPCLGGTPGMMGYGMAKAAVHQLVKSLSLASSGMPSSSCTLGILPVTLDTPMNRKFMPDADMSTWTPLEEVGRVLLGWTRGSARPASGALVTLTTRAGATTLTTDL